MAIEIKQQLIDEILENSSDVLTVSESKRLAVILQETLEKYVVEMTAKDLGNASDYIDAFLLAKATEGRSAKTITAYRGQLERFCSFAGVSPSQINVNHLRRYLSSMQERGLADKSRQTTKNCLSSFFGWLYAEKLIKDDPCTNLGNVKCRKEVLKPYSPVDKEKLRGSCGSLRDRAMVEFLLSTGCRISEVVALDYDQIDFQRNEVTVLGKGDKERVVYLTDVASMWVKRYLESRTDNSPALFEGRGTQRMTAQGVRVMLHTLSEAAGVENVHPHRFRRTLATDLINHGMSIQEVASILGHENINTTMKYVYVDKRNVKTAYERCSA